MARRIKRRAVRGLPVAKTSKLIAIIDDDESMQASLRDLIESTGLVARCFGSAEEFLESGLHPQVACLITDILMPKMSGLHLQARLKEGEMRYPDHLHHLLSETPGCGFKR